MHEWRGCRDAPKKLCGLCGLCELCGSQNPKELFHKFYFKMKPLFFHSFVVFSIKAE